MGPWVVIMKQIQCYDFKWPHRFRYTTWKSFVRSIIWTEPWTVQYICIADGSIVHYIFKSAEFQHRRCYLKSVDSKITRPIALSLLSVLKIDFQAQNRQNSEMLLNPLRNAMSAIKTSLPSPIPSTQFQPFQVGTQRTSSPKVSLLLFAEIFARFLLSPCSSDYK